MIVLARDRYRERRMALRRAAVAGWLCVVSGALLVGCSPPAPVFVAPLRDSDRSAAEKWAADFETVADAVGVGQVVFQNDPHPRTAVEYCNQGNGLANQGEFRAALRAKAAALYLAAATGDTMLTAHCAAGIALVYDYVRDPVRAQKWAGYAENALAEAPRQPGDPRPSYIRTMVLKVRADAALAADDLPKAQTHMEAALQAAQDNPPLVPWIKTGLANVVKRSDPDRAAALLTQVAAQGPDAYRAIAHRLLGDIALERDPVRARALFAELAASAQAQHDDYTLAWAYQGQAEASIKLGQSQAGMETYQQAIAAANRVRGWFHTEEFRSSTFGSLQDIFDGAVAVYMRNRRHSEAFEIAEQARARALRDQMHDTTEAAPPANAVAAGLQSGLPVSTAFVSYYVAPTELYMWKIDRGAIVGHTVPVSEKALGDLSRRFRFRSSQPSAGRSRAEAERSQAISNQLWDYLIRPLGIAPGTKLILAPHRILHVVPFAALRRQNWLINDHQLLFAPSAAAWVQTRARTRSLTTAIAFANPDEAGAPGDLKRAEEEAGYLAQLKLVAAPKIVAGPQATRGRFLASGPSYDLTHFAVHGEADTVEPGASALLLAGPTPQLSRLEAKDIYRLRLPRTSLITMSACDTAIGPTTRGDEVYSLTSAFTVAGAKNVITTLWPISDRTTADLMRVFYGNVAAGMAYPEALRQAQVKAAANPLTSSPVYWAGFQLVGAGDR